MKKYIQNIDLPHKLIPFIWRYLKDKKIYLFGFFFLSVVWAIEMSLSPYLLKVMIDDVVKFSQNKSQLISVIWIPAVLYVMMSMLLNVNSRLYDYINLRLNPEIKSAINKDMFIYLMHHSHAFFQSHFAGSLTRKMLDMANVDQLIGMINQWFYPRFFAMLIASGTLFIVVKPIFGIILFIWAILFVLLSYIAAKQSEKLARAESEAGSKMTGTMSDSVTNIMNTKLFANIPNEVDYISRDVDALVFCDRQLQWKNLKVNFIQSIGITVLIASMLIALVYGNIRGWVSPGDFALVLMLSIVFLRSVDDVGQQMLRFSKVVGMCNQALSFIRLPHEIIDLSDAKPICITKGEIKFQDVFFKYENNNLLFENLNVTINPGKRVGLVGYSGGGKSTFVKLILRLVDTQSGKIFIDNQNIKKVTEESLRKQIGTIPQDPDLFHRTIMENIRFAKLEANDDEVIEAAKKARCHEFISELPGGYQSLVGERGIKLSGGQKQRIAIARAFLKNAPVLLLDEATSSLDSITERYIQESLHAVMAGKTTIVIAHRLSTLKDMDRILVFDNGKIIEDGSLENLLENKEGHFYKLWQMQAEGFIPSVIE
jgi:ATP-binding cassette subfamily B protein